MNLDSWAPVISWLLVILGWKVAMRGHDARECRKEIRALLDAVRELVLSIEDRACEYYQLEQDDPDATGHANKMKRELTRLGSLIATLKASNPRFACDSELAEFRRVNTGSDFETAARTRRPPSDGLFHEITAASMKLLETLEASFVAVYPRK